MQVVAGDALEVSVTPTPSASGGGDAERRGPEGTAPTMEPPGALVKRAMEEIAEEAERHRAEGDLPARLARELDELFSRFAPVGSRRGEDLAQAVAMVDAAAFIDPMVPVESRIPGGRLAKRVLRKLSFWYASFITAQVSRFAATVARVLHAIDDRLEVIEEAVVPAALPPVVADDESGQHWWEDQAVRVLEGLDGRVLHAACGEGGLVRRLVRSGVDAYGIDPRADVVESAAADPDALSVIDLRPADVIEHLRRLPHGALSGVVLSGVTEVLGPSERLKLVDLLSSRITAEGLVVLHSLSPAAFERIRGGVAADMSPGRPMRAETWRMLFEERGFYVDVVFGPPLGRLERLPGEDEQARAMNANLDMLEKVLFGPADYLMVARRRERRASGGR